MQNKSEQISAPGQWHIQEEIHVERAHCATGVFVGRKEYARSIIVPFQNYKEKQRVLQAAWSKKDIQIND